MSISVVCRTPAPLFRLEGTPTDTSSALTKIADNKVEEHADQSSIWTMIQSQNSPTPNSTAPYVHPLVRRSASLMSESSLELCTESLGSETGSGDFSDDDRSWLTSSFNEEEQVVVKHKKREQQRIAGGENDGNQLMSVSYHCSASRRNPAPRSFPPPLPSISRGNGTCIQMRTCRHDGRLFVDAVPVVSQNYLHSCRHEGRLLLSFINSTGSQPTTEPLLNNEEQMVEKVTSPSIEINRSQEAVENEEEDEEEVEVLDRGGMVEVKVSLQPQHPGGAKKVLLSSLVINKFVGGTPLTNQNRWAESAQENHHSSTMAATRPPLLPKRRLTTTTTAAAAVAASSACTSSVVVGQHKPDNKLIFTSRRGNREEMLHQMRRCSELRRPLFFWEAGCIPTSS